MEKFTQHTGIAALLNRKNVDTDQIIPKQFLTKTDKIGYQDFLFYDWRYKSDKTPDPDFELNKPAFKGASILVTGDNFGCGSSREHAPWALTNYGFRAVISTSFADIFFNNSGKNGLLLISVSPEQLADLMQEIQSNPGVKFTIDLANQLISTPAGKKVKFVIDATLKKNLLNGFDEIEQSLQLEDVIRKFEQTQKKSQPWLWNAS